MHVLILALWIQSSYTPFLTENIYQSLRPFIPADPEADTRSIHFLSFPEVKEEYFDETIERQMKRMQTIIELGRNIRDRFTLSLKVCLLLTLTVFLVIDSVDRHHFENWSFSTRMNNI